MKFVYVSLFSSQDFGEKLFSQLVVVVVVFAGLFTFVDILVDRFLVGELLEQFLHHEPPHLCHPLVSFRLLSLLKGRKRKEDRIGNSELLLDRR